MLADSVGKYLYLYVTNDEYELPIAVAETPKELALMLGKSLSTVQNVYFRTQHGEIKDSRYKKILKDERAYRLDRQKEMSICSEMIKSLADSIVEFDGDDLTVMEKQIRGYVNKLIKRKKEIMKK